MKRGPQPKKAFDAVQSRARAEKLRQLMGFMKSARMRDGMETLAQKFEACAEAPEHGKSAGKATRPPEPGMN